MSVTVRTAVTKRGLSEEETLKNKALLALRHCLKTFELYIES